MIRRTSDSAPRTVSTMVRSVRTKLTMALLAVGAFLVITGISGSANAGSVTCTISNVYFDAYTGGRLAIFCNGETVLSNAIVSNVNETLCPAGRNKSMDVLKVWSSMTTAYQLAGRKIFIAYDDPSGTCNIKTIVSIHNLLP